MFKPMTGKNSEVLIQIGRSFERLFTFKPIYFPEVIIPSYFFAVRNPSKVHALIGC